MRIHEVMSTGVVTGTSADHVRDIVVKMLCWHCGAIPIVNANHELLGVVTLRDVMLPMYPNWEPIRHDLSTAANDLRPSASFSARNNPGHPLLRDCNGSRFQRIHLRFCRACGLASDRTSFASSRTAISDRLLGDYIHDAVRSRDFLEMEQNDPEVLAKKAEEIMVRNPLTVSPETPILEAASYMGLKNLRRIPVVDRGTLVGMVSIGDIHRGLFFARGGCEAAS